jgi:ADP-ribosyl-[dinitrogen reductase] hydrolase
MIGPDRAEGCLLGLACGDALGGAVEFSDRASLDRRFPDGIRDIMGGGPHRLAIGDYTDDTSMALAIARACTADGIDLDRVARNYVAWYRSGPKDIGIATSNALRLIADGIPWQLAGERLQTASAQGVAGNGTVMRCAPLAIRFADDPITLKHASIETSRMTHADSRATEGAVALNQAIAWLLRGGETEGLLDAAIARVTDQRVRNAITGAPSLDRSAIRSGGYVLDTLTAAFWCLLTTNSAEIAIRRAVELGDDADTTGAVVGALAGALYGQSGLPARWLSVIQDRHDIAALARRLAAWNDGVSKPKP